MFKFKSLYREEGTFQVKGKEYNFKNGEVLTNDIEVAKRLRISSSFKEMEIIEEEKKEIINKKNKKNMENIKDENIEEEVLEEKEEIEAE